MIRLSVWSSTRIEYHLKSAGARPKRRRKSRNAEEPVHGFANREPVYWLGRRFYAVYSDGARLFFQAGRDYWDITHTPVELKYESLASGIASRASVFQSGAAIHRAVLIHPSRAFWMKIDFTYDHMDAELENFFYFLSNHLHKDEWKERIIEMAADAA